jgi:hypothetical protein
VNLRHWVYGLESSQALNRVEGTDLWHLTLEIRRALARGVQARAPPQRRLACGSRTRSTPTARATPSGRTPWCTASATRPPSWSVARPHLAPPGTPRGLRLREQGPGRHRRCLLYLPARFRRTRQYPLIVVHDGSDYLKYSGMKNVLDNLIHRLEIPDCIVAFTDSPAACRSTPTTPEPRQVPHRRARARSRATSAAHRSAHARALVGASFGGVAPRSPRRSATRASGGGCCSRAGASRSPTSASATAAGRCSIAWSSWSTRSDDSRSR